MAAPLPILRPGTTVPNRAIAGSFINFEGGQYDALHYTATTGAGVSMVNWAIDRPFVFVEDSISYKRYIAVYESAQFDSPRGNTQTPAPGPGLGRDFFTLRVNPHPRVELDLNYNYFRDIPTFDPTLVGTGLLDKFLFQGFSAGARVEVMKQIFVSTNLGRSSGSSDAKPSLNEMYGVTFGRLPWLRLRADAHYARFNSSFGRGSYQSVSFSRQTERQPAAGGSGRAAEFQLHPHHQQPLALRYRHCGDHPGPALLPAGELHHQSRTAEL